MLGIEEINKAQRELISIRGLHDLREVAKILRIISEQAKETKKEETKTEEKSFKKIEPKHKWEDETVRKIYEEYLSGKGSISCGDLSRKYGVPRSTVWKIANNINWKVEIIVDENQSIIGG